ncbi:SDR family NAD(P)-dependent oxidoreductase [Actinomycetospora chiangmaiensis]|uniref:SDR family NAD(P)-dependent oxidoreductase n=1 Tax=Actinomycetospora chiangmaiensis TaxID=402650 RepID=UPI000373556A|nr:SDR family oxidoreductase [Actinomycetospora chiangmaiensis]
MTSSALVTGATSGIGRAVAHALGAAGHHVLVHGRDAARGADTVAAIRCAGGSAEFVAADLADPASCRALAATAADVDVLVNDAGTFPADGLTPDVTDHDLAAVFAVNVAAPHRLVAALAPRMAARGGGAIVNVLSMAAAHGMPGIGLYGASKAALAQLTRAWAVEFEPAGVRVNAVSPGPTRTEGMERFGPALDAMAAKAPAGRPATPAEIAAAVAFLAAPGSSFVQGAVLDVDGGRCAV